MRPVCLLFPILYTTLHHNLIKYNLIDLIERTFQREGPPYLACNKNIFLLWKHLKISYMVIVSKDANIRNRCNQVPHLTQDTKSPPVTYFDLSRRYFFYVLLSCVCYAFVCVVCLFVPFGHLLGKS